jgi:hypothetical protein
MVGSATHSPAVTRVRVDDEMLGNLRFEAEGGG